MRVNFRQPYLYSTWIICGVERDDSFLCDIDGECSTDVYVVESYAPDESYSSERPYEEHRCGYHLDHMIGWLRSSIIRARLGW